ncbi:hypothetical protein C8Q76DRAFT_604373 [Earliella scabrosa]|nr:hypothetical protein C8Q76DRAFT_604373 [Earliella scabrosa]
MGWTVGDLLHAMFQYGKCDPVRRNETQWRRVSAFLRGGMTCKPAEILKSWMHHPAGRQGSEDSKLFSSCPEDFEQSQSVRVALTCFAAQTVATRLVQEAEHAIDPKNGLHASRKRRKSDLPDEPTVVYNAISNLNFSRSNRANLLPIARGLLHFALSAPYDLYSYHSRIGTMPAYTTVYRTLEGLAKQEAEVVRAHGMDPSLVRFYLGDNVQNFLLQRDPALGRVNAMNIGIAATYIEAPDCPAKALDFDDKQRRLAENARSSLTVTQLLGFIDQRHVETVGILLLLRILVNTIPELAIYQSEVSLRYRTRGKKLPLKEECSKVHPLATSGKNETVTTELKDALVDFLQQGGQEPERYNRQLVLFCGDGLTFEKIVLLKHYLRFHDDPFKSFAIIEPILAPWHTVWTDIGRIFETYWGSFLSNDPSTLAYSAAKIHRHAPSNLSKPDFEKAMELLSTVHDARTLDCFRIHFGVDDILQHFTQCHAEGKLPSFEELEEHAKQVWRTFCTHRAAERALDPVGDRPDEEEHPNVVEWKKAVPLGTCSWPQPSSSNDGAVGVSTRKEGPDSTQTPPTASAAHALPQDPCTKTKRSKKKKEPEEPFLGDRVLANAINFMHDVFVVREFLYAVAEGDAGRVYEAMKIMLFVFAGTSHSKYTGYLLEFICALELESSPELRETVLKSTLVNLTGQPGRFAPADLIQEYLNRLLQAIAERKGVEYNSHFIREVLSRNLAHLARLRDDLQEGVGLAHRSGHHTEPRRRAELRILLNEYKRCELHCRCPGRTFVSGEENRKLSDFRQGVVNLRGGKLQTWIRESMFMRGSSYAPSGSDSAHSPSELEDILTHSSNHDTSNNTSPTTLPSMRVVNGDLVVESIDIAADVERVFDVLVEDDDEDEAPHEMAPPRLWDDVSDGE